MCVCVPSSELFRRRQEGDEARKEPDRGPEEPDEANPEGGQPALGEERPSSGGYGVGLQDSGRWRQEAGSVFEAG